MDAGPSQYQERPAYHCGVGAECERAENVNAASYAAVDDYLGPAAHGIDYLRQHLGGCGSSGKNSSAVV